MSTTQRGDTIVEVLIALAVLSFALITSYGILTRSLASARNSQEHSEATEYLNSQVELARYAATDPNLFTQTTPFCMNSIGQIVPSTNPACTVGQENFYQMTVIHTAVPALGNQPFQDVFTFNVKWPGVGHFGTQNETISYKLYQVTAP